jgi:hypothetical protein
MKGLLEFRGQFCPSKIFNENRPHMALSSAGRYVCISRARILRQFFEKACFQRVYVQIAEKRGGRLYSY